MQWHFLSSNCDIVMRFILVFAFSFNLDGYFPCYKKPNFTILIFYSRVVQVIENFLCAMFTFWWGFLHVSKDASYVKGNIVLSYVYQVHDVNFEGMFWTTMVGIGLLASMHSTIFKILF
jgi:hypothetical protein